MQIKNLTFTLSNQILIDNLSLEANKGLFFVYGPSGTGKTTLLKILAKLVKPSKGNIKIPKTIGTFWQNYNLLNLDIKSNLVLPFLVYKKKLDSKWENHLFDYFQLNFSEKDDIEKLSSGEKERIGIIKAFIHKPELVLLDEVGNSLDEKLKIKLLDFLLDYSKKNIIFLVSHDYYFKVNLKGNLIYDKNFKIYQIQG